MLVTSSFASKSLPLPEVELVSQLKLRTEKAFSYLYDFYAASLFGLIKKLINCPDTAEDILQNVFIKVWSNANSYCADKGSLFTWMSRIARNETIDYLRSKQGKKAGVTGSIEQHGIGSAAGEIQLSRYDIDRSLSRIPKNESQIIQLYSSGFTCREIGRMLSMPEGTVKTKMRTAYKKLRLIMVA